jgi:hypothetical protein
MDPETGRFITLDPMRDGLNWYAYVENNPLRFNDPTGFEREWEQKTAEAANRNYGTNLTKSQQLGAAGEKATSQLLEENGMVVAKTGKSVAATGPDIVCFDPKTKKVYIIDNKETMAADKTIYNLKGFESEEAYIIWLAKARKTIKEATNLTEEQKFTMIDAIETGNVIKAVSTAGEGIKGLGPKLIEQGVKFISNGKVMLVLNVVPMITGALKYNSVMEYFKRIQNGEAGSPEIKEKCFILKLHGIHLNEFITGQMFFWGLINPSSPKEGAEMLINKMYQDYLDMTQS